MRNAVGSAIVASGFDTSDEKIAESLRLIYTSNDRSSVRDTRLSTSVPTLRNTISVLVVSTARVLLVCAPVVCVALLVDEPMGTSTPIRILAFEPPRAVAVEINTNGRELIFLSPCQRVNTTSTCTGTDSNGGLAVAAGAGCALCANAAGAPATITTTRRPAHTNKFSRFIRHLI